MVLLSPLLPLLLVVYAFSDYIASSICSAIFHPKPSVRVLVKQLRINVLVLGMLWCWFFGIEGISMFSADPTINYVTKSIMLGDLHESSFHVWDIPLC
jgi:hypothetical protein